MINNTLVENKAVENKKKLVFDEKNCPIMATMHLIGGKWKIILINRIHQDSPARFGELRRCLKGITQSMLTAQLRELEEAGIIHREIYAEVPPKVEYTLTDFGLTLQPIVQSIADWGQGRLGNK